MKLKLTPAQAEILYRLLGENSTVHYVVAMNDDLQSDEMHEVWSQLDDKMGERDIFRGSYAGKYGSDEKGSR